MKQNISVTPTNYSSPAALLSWQSALSRHMLQLFEILAISESRICLQKAISAVLSTGVAGRVCMILLAISTELSILDHPDGQIGL